MNLLPVIFALLSTGATFVDARRITTGSSHSSTGSTIAKGALIAIVVCVVVGVILLLICCFCACKIMRGRKAKNAGNIEAPVYDKPVEPVGQPYGQQSYTPPVQPAYGGGPTGAYGNTDGYGAQQPNYGGQPEYAAHQNEYNAGYNSGGATYAPPGQTTYAPPSGPPNASMGMPNPGHY